MYIISKIVKICRARNCFATKNDIYYTYFEGKEVGKCYYEKLLAII